MRAIIHNLFLAAALWSAQGALALDDGDGTANNCNDYNPLNNPYFGDLHVHTTFSVDGFTLGTDTTPEQAYEFAQGAQIGLHPFDENGEPTRFAQIDRPLDFAMVSDHAEFFGEFLICQDPAHAAYNHPTCELLRRRTFIAAWIWINPLLAPQDEVIRLPFCGPTGSMCSGAAPIVWWRMQQAAQQYYDRSSDCSFTTFVGYEWSGSPARTNEQGNQETDMLHRNVVFRNSIVPNAPASYFDAPYPSQLYDKLESDCINREDSNGDCDALVIPHNSNLSHGAIFDNINPDGTPYNMQDVLQRGSFERLIEVIQHKGASECLPGGTDELCGFEFVPAELLVGEPANEAGTVRDALKQGLQVKETLGANPFKFGMIGSTDSHLGAPGLVQESADYPGHTAGFIGDGSGLTDRPIFNPGGIAVVWASQNSRAALFDAMHRREVYATSGPRHVVRFFGGYDLPGDICNQPDLVEVAYNNGVPMGAELPANNPNMANPKFVVWANKDAGTPAHPGNDLQRLQIVKGWTDATGAAHEQVYDIAGNASNGAGVDTNTCTTTGSGFTELCQHWEDPDFDPTEDAFYYARVVENPSCRWIQQQCIALDSAVDCNAPTPHPLEWASCCDVNVPKTVQERSWTSPIWYRKGMPPGC